MEFAPPPPLGFPCIDFVRDRVKTVFDQLSQEQADVRHSSGEDLVIRHFEVPSYVTSSLPRKPKTKACLSCKSRKLKCDGEQPCVRCIDAGESCQYPPGIQPLPKSTVADSRLTTSGSSHRSSDHTVSADQSISSASHTMHSHHDILSRVNIQQPLITNRFGHYMGETSFYYEVSDTAPSMIEKFPSIANMRAPTFSLDDQAYLIDLYFSFSHPYAPIISKVSLKQQLYQWQLGNPTFLSPLFFFAFFAFASTFSDRADITDKGQKLLTYCNALRDVYLDKPRVSTILALLLMAQHLEQQKLHEKLSRVWIWSGEAFRMTQDMGLHRQCNTTVDGFCKELRIRAFWIAFMADRCLAMVYGRPLVFDERDITVPIPSFTEYDAEEDQQWITNFAVFIDLSRISGRLIKNFYMPQSPIEGPSTEAMRSTLDNWIYSLFNEKPKEDDDGADTDEMLSDSLAMTQQRFDTQKQMWLHGLLILLHSPFMNHELAQKSVSSSTSLEICYYSATIITDIAERLIRDDVFFFSRSCINIYATIKALQIHSMGAGHLKDQKFTVFSQLNFEKTIAMLRKLPQHCHGTMLTDVVEASEKKFYEQRQNPTSCVSNLGNAGEFRKPSSDTMDDSPNNHCNSRSISIQDPNRHHGKRSHPISKPSSKPPFKIICFDPSSRIITRDKPHMKVEVSRQLDNNNPEPLEYAHPPHPPTPLSASAQLAYQPVSPAQPPLMPYMDQHSCSTISTENTPLILYHDPFFSAASANPLFSGHAEEGSVPHTTISANTLPSWNNDTFVSNYSLFPTQ